MPRILHVITGLSRGGAEMMLYKLLSARKQPYEHAVLSLAPAGPVSERISALGVPVYSLDLRAAAPNPARVWGVRSVAQRLAPHLLVGWMYHGNIMASLAAWGLAETQLIWGIRSSLYDLRDLGWRTAAIVRLGARRSQRPDAIIYASQISRIQHEAHGYCADRAVVIPNGTDCSEFLPDERARAEVRAELGVDEHQVLVGLIARLHPMKDHAGFLRAAAIVARTHPQARFLLVGRGVATDPVLRNLVRELAIADRVVLQDERSDIPRITASLDLACSASGWGEAFSNAVGEAMACAVPCVVTDIGDSAYLVGETGISVPPGNPPALAHALEQLILAGADGRRRLGAAARQRIERDFSLPAVSARYEEFYGRHLPAAQEHPVRSFEASIA